MIPSTMSNNSDSSQIDVLQDEHNEEKSSNSDSKTEMLRQALLLEEDEDDEDDNVRNVTISPDILRALGGSLSTVKDTQDVPVDLMDPRAIRSARSSSLGDLDHLDAPDTDSEDEHSSAPDLLRTLRGIQRANSDRSLVSLVSLPARSDASNGRHDLRSSFQRSLSRSGHSLFTADVTDSPSGSSIRTVGSPSRGTLRRRTRVERSKSENVDKMKAIMMSSQSQSLLGKSKEPSQSSKTDSDESLQMSPLDKVDLSTAGSSIMNTIGATPTLRGQQRRRSKILERSRSNSVDRLVAMSSQSRSLLGCPKSPSQDSKTHSDESLHKSSTLSSDKDVSSPPTANVTSTLTAPTLRGQQQRRRSKMERSRSDNVARLAAMSSQSRSLLGSPKTPSQDSKTHSDESLHMSLRLSSDKDVVPTANVMSIFATPTRSQPRRRSKMERSKSANIDRIMAMSSQGPSLLGSPESPSPESPVPPQDNKTHSDETLQVRSLHTPSEKDYSSPIGNITNTIATGSLRGQPRRRSKIERSKSENVDKLRASMSHTKSLLGSPEKMSPHSERTSRSSVPLSQDSKTHSDEILHLSSSLHQEQKQEDDERMNAPVSSSSSKRKNSGGKSRSVSHEHGEKKSSHRDMSSSRHHRRRHHTHHRRRRHHDGSDSSSPRRTMSSRSRKQHRTRDEKSTTPSKSKQMHNNSLESLIRSGKMIKAEETNLISILQFDPATTDNVRVMMSESIKVLESSSELLENKVLQQQEQQQQTVNQEPPVEKDETVSTMEKLSPKRKSSKLHDSKQGKSQEKVEPETPSKNSELASSKHGGSKKKSHIKKLLLPWRKKHHELMHDQSLSSFNYAHDPAFD